MKDFLCYVGGVVGGAIVYIILWLSLGQNFPLGAYVRPIPYLPEPLASSFWIMFGIPWIGFVLVSYFVNQKLLTDNKLRGVGFSSYLTGIILGSVAYFFIWGFIGLADMGNDKTVGWFFSLPMFFVVLFWFGIPLIGLIFVGHFFTIKKPATIAGLKEQENR